jgi:TRAP-type C4-dicarboxylate transport system permease small subunit
MGDHDDSTTDRKRRPVRGVALFVLAVAMAAVTANTILRGPFEDPSAWVVTVVIVQILTALFLAALGYSELRGPRGRRDRQT